MNLTKVLYQESTGERQLQMAKVKKDSDVIHCQDSDDLTAGS
jgi:hypothetical protein